MTDAHPGDCPRFHDRTGWYCPRCDHSQQFLWECEYVPNRKKFAWQPGRQAMKVIRTIAIIIAAPFLLLYMKVTGNKGGFGG